MITAYYNEIDPYASAWLRNLIAAGLIAPGDVDERSIEDVRPDDLRGYTQCHFFAGIGVWSHALRSAGWPDSRPVWTGSCPCQPFSSAGKGVGFDDPRHLWPEFHRLIRECRPGVVIGEQVADRGGLAWLDLVQADLEGEDYAFGALDLCAAGIGAPHIRQRLYWLAHAGASGLPLREPQELPGTGRRGEGRAVEQRRGASGGLADTDERGRPTRERDGAAAGHWLSPPANRELNRPGPTNGFWRDADWLGCRDGKWRPVEPGTFPLAHGVAGRVGQLRAYGNAIVAPLAQAFVEATQDTLYPPVDIFS